MKFTRSYFIIFFLLCVGSLQESKAQGLNVDSLLNRLKVSKDSVDINGTYISLSAEYNKKGKLFKGIEFGKKAAGLSERLKDTANQITALVNLGHVYSGQGAYSASLGYYQAALTLAEVRKDPSVITGLYSSYGSVYTRLHDFDKAKALFYKGLDIAIRSKQKESIAGFYNNLGILFRNMNELDKAGELYQKGLALCREIGDKRTEMQTLNNLAFIQSLKGRNERAKQYYENSLAIALELKDKFQEELVLGNIAMIFYQHNDYKSSLDYFNRSLAIANEIGDLEGKVNANIALAEIYNNNFHDYKLALEHYSNYMSSKTKLDSTNNEKELQKAELKFEYEKEKALLKKEQEKQTLIEKEKQAKQRYIIYSVTGCLIIVGILLVFLYKRFMLTKAQKIIIEEQKKLVDEKQKEVLDSINYAKRIQDSLFDNFELISHFFSDAFLINQPKDIVSGDFYWIAKKMITKQDGNHSQVKELFYVAVCDSTGHGVPGGFMSLLNSSYLSEAVNEKNILEPNKILDHVRDRLIHAISKNNQKDGFDGILMCIEKTFEFKDRIQVSEKWKASYACAHNAPLLIRGNEMKVLNKNNMPVGLGERKEDFTLFEIDLQKGDCIYLYTDGFADQFGGPKARLIGSSFGQGKKLKYKKLDELLLSNHLLPFHKQSEKLTTFFKEWKGDLDQVDDVLLIGIKI